MPILSAMNRDMYGVIRWCTPSIHPRVPKVNGIYDSDMSISYHSLGNPSLNTGIFKEATELAAKTYKSDYSLFCVNGSSGSNFIVLRTLSRQFSRVNMIASRNIHKSVSVAIEDYGINVNYLTPHYDEDFQIFIPNTIEEYEEAIISHPETNVVFISNPTYEGVSIDLPKLVKKVRSINPKIIIYVDEAWGSLFSFSDKLPVSAMQSGADICVQSTHKQGSGLQQTSLIHVKGTRIDREKLMNSYASLITTSPSFHLLASIDAARYLMDTQGSDIIDQLIRVADLLFKQLEELKELRVIHLADIIKKYPQVSSFDRTKILVNIKNTGLAGYEIAKKLEVDYKIILEKYEADNILFISTFQNTACDVDETTRRIKTCIETLPKGSSLSKISFPSFPIKIEKALSSYEVIKLANKSVSFDKAVGCICAEDVVPYPPGIPLITRGEVIHKEHIDYLKAIKKLKGLISLIISNEKESKILVVDQKK